jgi:hypothetical protein
VGSECFAAKGLVPLRCILRGTSEVVVIQSVCAHQRMQFNCASLSSELLLQHRMGGEGMKPLMNSRAPLRLGSISACTHTEASYRLIRMNDPDLERRATLLQPTLWRLRLN